MIIYVLSLSFLFYFMFILFYRKIQFSFFGSDKKDIDNTGFLNKNVVFSFELSILVILFLIFDSIAFSGEHVVFKMIAMWGIMFVLLLDDASLYRKILLKKTTTN